MSILDTIPADGSEFRVRIARRWFTAAMCVNAETGARFLGVKLAGADWLPVAEDVIEKIAGVGGASGRRAERELDAPQDVPAPSNRGSGASGRLAERESDAPDESRHEQTRERVTAMVKAIRYMPDIEGRFLMAGQRIQWPQTTYDADDIKAQRENDGNRDAALRPPRHKITPRDLALLDETWGWFCRLDPLDAKERRYLIRGRRLPLSSTQTLVWRVALGASFKSLASKGESDETVRRRYHRAIDQLAAIAAAGTGAARRAG